MLSIELRRKEILREKWRRKEREGKNLQQGELKPTVKNPCDCVDTGLRSREGEKEKK